MNEQVCAEVIVVGSGIAGAMCAYELAKQGVDVLILEAGPEVSRKKIIEEFKRSDVLDLSVGYPNEKWAPRPDSSGREDSYLNYIEYDYSYPAEYLSVVGGTTWHWGGTAMRMLPVDFRMHSQYGVARDWPITYDDLEPFYTRAEYEIGVSGDSDADDGTPHSRPYPLPPFPPSYVDKYVADHLETSGLEFIALPVARNSENYDGRSQCKGFGSCTPICPSGAQYNASIHVEHAKSYGARLVANARVNRLFSDSSGTVQELEYSSADGKKQRARARVFVLAVNGMETPKLLLMSVDKFNPQGMCNQSGMVGKNLYGHVDISSQMLLPAPVYPYRGPNTTLHCRKFRDGAFRKQHASWNLTIDNGVFLFRAHTETIVAIEDRLLLPPDLDISIHSRLSRRLRINCMLDQLPDQNNTISLDWSSRDSSGQPRVNVRWKIDNYVRHGADEAEKLMRSISRTLGAEEFDITFPSQPHHIMGTTRMGSNADNSVVNSQCRAHDHDNLYLISSSVFPTGGTANPSLTIAALSLRAAESIALDLAR